MLKLLHIENIAVIEKCDIEFGKGFNVLTGETGAGKSIIIDSISAVLGYRTTREVVRHGAAKASVTALFVDCSEEAKRWLLDNGYDAEGDEVLISREITADGKSSAKINGKPVTAAILRSFGIMMINILGQHDSRELLDVESHAVFIDRFASNESFLEIFDKYTSVYNELSEKKQERKRLDTSETEKARQVEMLKFQISELEAANLIENEDEELLEKQKLMRESAKLTEKLNLAYSLFDGAEGFPGISSAAGEASKALVSISGLSERLSKLSDSVAELSYDAFDIAEELRDILDGLDFSDADADRVESRLDLLHKLKRKYGSSVSEMLSYLENAKRELSEIEFSEERIIALDKEISELSKLAYSYAEELLSCRRAAAKVFEERITKELLELDMKNARFVVDFKKNDELSPRGIDSVEFLFSANLGEVTKPLEKIASGGELSRIMLSLKNALDEKDYIETLIFDEIDTGVSGRAAQKIAEKLYRLSVKKQVLCVTHLAQLSAMSDIHFKIEKSERDGRTFTNVTTLDRNGRALELARITGGSEISDTTIKNAEEMLSLAEVTKAKIV